MIVSIMLYKHYFYTKAVFSTLLSKKNVIILCVRDTEGKCLTPPTVFKPNGPTLTHFLAGLGSN